MDKYISEKKIVANDGLDKLFDPYILEDGTMISAMNGFRLVKNHKVSIKINSSLIVGIDLEQKLIWDKSKLK